MAYKGTVCSAVWCKNVQGYCTRFGKNISFFRIPTDPERAKEWVKFCLREDLMGKDLKMLHDRRVCEEHFLESDYIRRYPTRRLKRTAIPTVMDVLPVRENPDNISKLEAVPLGDGNSMTTVASVPDEESFPADKESLFVSQVEKSNKTPKLEMDPLGCTNRMAETASPEPHGETLPGNEDTRGSSSEDDVKPDVDTWFSNETEQMRADKERIMKHPYECCRLCLERSDNLTDIFQGTELGLVIRQAIKDFLHFEVVRNGESPWQVCYTCMQKLSEFQEFKDRCVETKILWDDCSKYIDESTSANNARSTETQVAENIRLQPELHSKPDVMTGGTVNLLQHAWKEEERTGNEMITTGDGDLSVSGEYSMIDEIHLDGGGCESHLNPMPNQRTPVHQNTEPSSTWQEDKENSTAIQVKGMYELDDSKGSDGEPLVLILRVDGAVELCALSEIPLNMRAGIQKYSKMAENLTKKRPREKGD